MGQLRKKHKKIQRAIKATPIQTTPNLTRTMLRFLKNNDAFFNFPNALATNDNGRKLLGFLNVYHNRKQSKYDPIAEWLSYKPSKSNNYTVADFFNSHIHWDETIERHSFWSHINTCWSLCYQRLLANPLDRTVYEKSSYSAKNYSSSERKLADNNDEDISIWSKIGTFMLNHPFIGAIITTVLVYALGFGVLATFDLIRKL